MRTYDLSLVLIGAVCLGSCAGHGTDELDGGDGAERRAYDVDSAVKSDASCSSDVGCEELDDGSTDSAVSGPQDAAADETEGIADASDGSLVRDADVDASDGSLVEEQALPPSVTSMVPSGGPYGTEVTITGENLGLLSEPETHLLLGGNEDLSYGEQDAEGLILSWSEEEIRFLFPFPADGMVEIETESGSAIAGDFVPSWAPGVGWPAGPAVAALCSVSPAPGHVAVLLDFTPPVLVDFGPEAAVESEVEVGSADPGSVRLYVNDAGELEGVGVSYDPEPEIVHLQNTGGRLQAVPTGVLLETTDYVVAGGRDGAAVWMNREDGWSRARPGVDGWAIDYGPIADPRPSSPLLSAAATSDGVLYVAWSEDVGGLLDDMGAPYMRRLSPGGDVSDEAVRAGDAVDDYLTSLELEGIGQGIIVRYCGSDVDPLGVTADSYRCYASAHAIDASSGTFRTSAEDQAVYAFSRSLIARGRCDGSDYLVLTGALGIDPDEPALFPCPRTIALEIDGRGELLPMVVHGGNLYSPRRRP